MVFCVINCVALAHKSSHTARINQKTKNKLAATDEISQHMKSFHRIVSFSRNNKLNCWLSVGSIVGKW